MIVASIVVALLLGVAFLMTLVHFFWASSEHEPAAAASSAHAALAEPLPPSAPPS
jgi:hypothetical protein